MTDDVDYGELDEGIRELVRLLREVGFDTTDSGDGKKTDMECAMPCPNVACVTRPSNLVDESRRMVRVLAAHGVRVEACNMDDRPQIQGTFDPVNNSAVIVLTHVTDNMLRWPQ
jgi:hypothetical protein